MIENLKLGKTAARPEAVSFKLRNFINPTALPKPPRSFGHEKFIGTQDWGMLGNDNAGDCVFAGAAHETMLWNAAANKKVDFSTNSVISDYSAVTGYDPLDPSTDEGTNMKDAASYRRRIGILDAAGQRHTVAAYLAIDPTNLTEHYQALYLFGAVGIGFIFPSSAWGQFIHKKPWSPEKGSGIEGGHYVPLVSKRRTLQTVTWGRLQGMTTAFFSKYNDESIAYVSLEMLTNNKSPEGFDAQGLMSCLAQLNH